MHRGPYWSIRGLAAIAEVVELLEAEVGAQVVEKCIKGGEKWRGAKCIVYEKMAGLCTKPSSKLLVEICLESTTLVYPLRRSYIRTGAALVAAATGTAAPERTQAPQ